MSRLILPDHYASDVARVPEMARQRTFGENLPASVADVSRPAPEDWERQLRIVSPITEHYSHLRFYYYRAKDRWVLYDCLPQRLMPRDGPSPGVPCTCEEIWQAMEGKPPRALPPDDDRLCPFVSDVQHEFWRLYGVYARPFWVLQGLKGGHQVNFSPWQQNVLLAKGLPATPPMVGALPACPFDGRTIQQLTHLNRLHQMENNVDRLRNSGSRAAAEAEMAVIEKEVRLAEAQFIETQMTDVVDMATSLARGPNTRSEHMDQLISVRPGLAAEAADAYARYLETGEYTMKDVTGIGS